MRAARILRHVSTDAANRLRGRIRSVKIILRRYAPSDVEIDDPRLHHHSRIREINFEDTIHARQADDNSVFNWERAAAQTRARPACYKRNSFSVTDSNDGLHLIRGIWQQHRARHHAEIGQSVA